MITISINDNQVKKLLNNLQSNLKNMRPVMEKISKIMHDAVEKNFEHEGRPRWKPSKRALREGGKTLQDTGSLVSSISTRYDSHSAVVGTNKRYAAIHQFGGKAGRKLKATIPPRPFLKLTKGDLKDIKEAITEYLKRS